MVNLRKSENQSKPRKITVDPYRACYAEGGLIETVEGIYTVGYRVTQAADPSNITYNAAYVKQCYEVVLLKLSEMIGFQFTIRNTIVDMRNFLSHVLIHPGKTPEINKSIEKYNHAVKENVSIGHNNFARSILLTLSIHAGSADEALRTFLSKEPDIVDAFQKLYGYQVMRMTLEERLAVLYVLFNPKGDEANFTVKWASRKKHTSTKRQIAPTELDTKHQDYMRVSGTYARTLFINALPSDISDSLLNDLAAVSSKMVVSITYQPIDSKIGYQASLHHVKNNTEVKSVAVRDTVMDRKNHKVIRQETVLSENETEYFSRTALELFKDALAKGHPTLLVSIIITLYADSLEDLDRDHELLKVSASKYACQIKPADLIQQDAFYSMLPLCHNKIQVCRTFSLSQMVNMQPLHVQSIFERIKTVHGLNAINDNLVLLDRSNYLAGLISGVPHSGKSYAVRREMLNALMTTEDEVIVLSGTGEYREYVQSLGGKTYDAIVPDPFAHDSNYNLIDDYEKLLVTYLEAWITVRVRAYNSRRNHPILAVYKTLAEDEKQEIAEEIKIEAEKLAVYRDYGAACEAAVHSADDFKWFLKAVEDLTVDTIEFSGERIRQVTCRNEMELLSMLDYVWNYSIVAKKQNRNIWIFVDAIDELLYSVAGSDYLIAVIDRTENLHVPFTMVIQEAAQIINHVEANIEFDYLLGKLDYFKLLTQGPIERKTYVERLNIPATLVPYITDREPGEGVIITPATNIAFSDRLFHEIVEI